MPFHSDKQRKGFFASKGNVRSSITPTLVQRKFISKKIKCLFAVEGIRTTLLRGEFNTTIIVRARTGAQAKRIAKKKFRLFGVPQTSSFEPSRRLSPKVVRCD